MDDSTNLTVIDEPELQTVENAATDDNVEITWQKDKKVTINPNSMEYILAHPEKVITFSVAQRLKMLGFDKPSKRLYDEKGNILLTVDKQYSKEAENIDVMNTDISQIFIQKNFFNWNSTEHYYSLPDVPQVESWLADQCIQFSAKAYPAEDTVDEIRFQLKKYSGIDLSELTDNEYPSYGDLLHAIFDKCLINMLNG